MLQVKSELHSDSHASVMHGANTGAQYHADQGKSAIHLARAYSERKRNFTGQSFWARGYYVSTVGRDEEVIRNYIRHQEQEDERLDQLALWK